MREHSFMDELGEDAEGGRLARLALAGRSRRRKTLGKLAVAKKLREQDFDDIEDDDEDGSEDTHLGRLLPLAAARRRRRRTAALGIAAARHSAEGIGDEDDVDDDDHELGRLLLLAAARRRARSVLAGIAIARRNRDEDDIGYDDEDGDDQDAKLGKLLLMAAAKRRRTGRASLLGHFH